LVVVVPPAGGLCGHVEWPLDEVVAVPLGEQTLRCLGPLDDLLDYNEQFSVGFQPEVATIDVRGGFGLPVLVGLRVVRRVPADARSTGSDWIDGEDDGRKVRRALRKFDEAT
jgi:hypothetical protein